ncbi:MAG: hypothetical protein WCO10_03310 [bacterium]
MRSNPVRDKIITALSETPLISFACKKAGISRATFYRWKKDNKDFRDRVDVVLEHGREHISEMCEAALIKEAKNGNMVAIRFWLSNNEKRYLPRRTIYVDPSVELIAGQSCKYCGHKKKNMGSNPRLGFRESTDAEIERVAALFARCPEVEPSDNVGVVMGNGSSKNNKPNNSSNPHEHHLTKEEHDKISKRIDFKKKPLSAYED